MYVILAGGLDGVYKLSSCHNGRPLYKRQNSPAQQDRVLWYSKGFGDWDFSASATPDEAGILMYGGDLEHTSVPLFVPTWFIGADLQSGTNMTDEEYVPVKMTVKCADGKVYKQPSKDAGGNQGLQKVAGPVLTEDEIESKYRYIYEKYGKRPEPSVTVNFTFVILLVMIGLTIVLVMPYWMLKKKGQKGGALPIAASFAQIIQNSKKKQSGKAG